MTDRNGDELTDEQVLYEAKEVQQFLKHPAVLAAFAATEAAIKKQWEAADNPLAREMCWHKFQAFKDLKRELHAVGDRRPVLTGH